MDWLIFLATFAVLYRAGEQRLTFTQCAWLAGTSAFFYMLASLGAGFITSRKNARLILWLSTALTLLGIMVCLFAGRFNTMLAGMAMLGVFPALFFNSFQAFMRGESAPGGLMKTVGIYTLSWSMGTGMGFISSGSFYSHGPSLLAVLSLAIGLAIIIVIIRHKRRPLEEISSEEYVETEAADARPSNARYVWVGWIIIFTAMFVQKPLTSFFPAICAAQGVGSLAASLPLFLIFAVQAFAGLIMARCRRFLYRRSPFVAAHALAALLFFIIWIRPVMSVSVFAFSLLGVYFGFAFFCSVYYSSNSGNRVLNVGINEFLVGTASLAGIFISEWWMRFTADSSSMYAVCAIMLSVSVVLQFFTAGAAHYERGRRQKIAAGEKD